MFFIFFLHFIQIFGANFTISKTMHWTRLRKDKDFSKKYTPMACVVCLEFYIHCCTCFMFKLSKLGEQHLRRFCILRESKCFRSISLFSFHPESKLKFEKCILGLLGSICLFLFHLMIVNGLQSIFHFKHFTQCQQSAVGENAIPC